jgi:hypothetical protein
MRRLDVDDPSPSPASGSGAGVGSSDRQPPPAPIAPASGSARRLGARRYCDGHERPEGVGGSIDRAARRQRADRRVTDDRHLAGRGYSDREA